MTSDLLVLDGSLTLRDEIALPDGRLPDGSVATVKVVDAEGEVLAATAVAVEQPPVEFVVTIDPALVPAPDQLFIWAMLRTEAGVWGTPELVPVGNDDTAVVLSRVDT